MASMLDHYIKKTTLVAEFGLLFLIFLTSAMEVY
jgi:hypothetical protein